MSATQAFNGLYETPPDRRNRGTGDYQAVESLIT